MNMFCLLHSFWSISKLLQKTMKAKEAMRPKTMVAMMYYEEERENFEHMDQKMKE